MYSCLRSFSEREFGVASNTKTSDEEVSFFSLPISNRRSTFTEDIWIHYIALFTFLLLTASGYFTLKFHSQPPRIYTHISHIFNRFRAIFHPSQMTVVCDCL